MPARGADAWRVAIENGRLAHWYARRFAGRGLDHDDLVQEGMIGLARAADEFDASRGVPFSSYARFHLLRYMRQATDRGRWARLKSGPIDGDRADDRPPPALDDDERAKLLGAVDLLDPRWARVIRDRYLADPPKLQREIAAGLGITTTRVCQIERKALARLATLLTDPNL